jgi:hypothetical protein
MKQGSKMLVEAFTRESLNVTPRQRDRRALELPSPTQPKLFDSNLTLLARQGVVCDDDLRRPELG